MANPREQILLADIGATNARFALFIQQQGLGPVRALLVADYPQLADAAATFLDGHRPSLGGALFAVAGPVDDNRCALTNCAWTVDAAELRRSLDTPAVRVINDFEAAAWSLSGLEPAHGVALGGGQAAGGAPMVVLGPGSGLGMACLVPGNGRPFVIAGEGGHATLPASSAREDPVIDWLRRRFAHVSAERALSGPGLENLYRALAAVDGASVPERNAVEITQAGLAGACPVGRAALDMFCAMLGTFAGNAALSFGARGGVFIAGGIAPRIVAHLVCSEFRARFEAKGRFRAYVEAIPSSVIVHPDYTFLGLRSLAERQAGGLG
jgi:glucokinase